MKKINLFAMLSVFMMLFAPLAVQAGPKAVAEPPLLAVKFHADWCGSCKAMGPLFEDLQNKFDQKNVLFVKLDFTNSTTSHHSKLLSKALGIGEVVEENKGTGFILLLDSQGEVKQKFTKQNSIKDIFKALKENLKG